MIFNNFLARIKLLPLLFAFVLQLAPKYVVSQTYTMSNGGSISSCSGTFLDPGGAGNYTGGNSDWTYTICNPTAGQPIYVDFNSFDLWKNSCVWGVSKDELFVYNGPNTSSPQIAVYADNTTPPNVITGSSGCLTFRFHRENLGGLGCASNPGAGGWAAIISCTQPPSGATCPDAYPFCTAISYNFQNSTGTTSPVGPNYGCLVSQPNPVWYYMKVDTGGPFQIGLSQNTGANGSGSGTDVDFALYGPFTSLNAGCTNVMSGSSPPIQCSFSPSSTETIGLGLPGGTGAGASTPPAGVVDQYYILLLTNFAGSNGYISFNQTGGSGVADCSILNPCDLTNLTAIPGACNASTNNFTLTGQVTFAQPPTVGTLTVSSSCGGSQVFNPPFTSPINYSLTGLPSNGASCSVTAVFSDDVTCTRTQTFNAPASCTTPCVITASSSASAICSGSTINLSATSVASATYSWSGPSGFTSSVQNPLAVNPPIAAGSYTYTVIATSPLTSCTATTTVTVSAAPTVNANIDQTICQGGTITLAGSMGGGATSTTWSAPSGSFSNASSLTSTYSPTITSGTINLTLTSNASGSCSSASDVMIVTVVSSPTVNANIDQTICAGGTITLAGTIGGGASSATWSAPTGTFSNSASLTSTYTPSIASGTINLTLTSNAPATCSAVTDVMVVTVSPVTVVNANSDQTVCAGGVVNLAGTISGGATTGSWSAPSGTFSSSTSLTSTYTPIISSGTVTISLSSTASSSCPSVSDVLVITVDPVATVNAGLDQSICAGGLINLNGSIGGSATSASWSASSGTFSNLNSLTSDYTPSLNSGSIVLTLSTNAPGSCPSVSDVIVLTVNPLPIVSGGNDVSSCTGQNITLNGSGAASYVWDNNVQNGVSFVPSQSGTYNVIGTDVNGCVGTSMVNVVVNSLPTISFTSDKTTGCYPLLVTFTNTSLNTSTCFWQFGDGSTSSNSCGPISHVYNQAGCFDVTFIGTSMNGCVASSSIPSMICTDAPPVASFTATPNPISVINSEVMFVNSSIGAAYYSWDFGDYVTSTQVNPQHDYLNVEDGSISVVLIAESSFGCKDTARLVLSVEEKLVYFVPNTFTPNSDGFNAGFKPVFTSGYDPFDFEMIIFNRWGEQIFETHDSNYGWSGNYGVGSNQNECQDGVYTYNITFKSSINGERRVITGHVNLIR